MERNDRFNSPGNYTIASACARPRLSSASERQRNQQFGRNLGDASKEKFDTCCIGEHGEKAFSLTFSVDRGGFEKFPRTLSLACIRITMIDRGPPERHTMKIVRRTEKISVVGKRVYV
jgi:hypothetical protein